MKVLAETTGTFQLVDFSEDRQVLQAHRPSVVTMSNFLQMRIAAQQLRILGKVNDEATDEEFAKFWTDSEDSELATASFLSAYELVELTDKTVVKKKAK